MQRFYTPGAEIEPGAELPLTPEASAQVARVLRLRLGARVVLFTGDGREWEGELQTISPSRCTVRVEEARSPQVELSCALHVAVAVLKGEKLDWTVQKLTELGAARISLVQTDRTIVTAGEERWAKRIVRLRRIAEEAAEQSGRVAVPVLREPVRLKDLLQSASEECRLFLDPLASEAMTQALRPCPAEVLVCVGPEGGFTENELERAREAGVRPVRMGARILRAETAAITAAALVASAADEAVSR